MDNPGYPQFAYQVSQGLSYSERLGLFVVGSGNIFINTRDYGLDSDLSSMVISTESYFNNEGITDPAKRRVTKYNCKYINLI
jgi:hypothetical protein